MVKIEAIIRPQKLEAVQAALEELDFHGMTVTEVRGMGRQRGATYTYRGSQYTLNLGSKLKVEVVVLDGAEGEVIDAIVSSAQTGEVGDGKIFVTHLADVVRIRTGERGDAALS
jgi:nitrogen regulatory protein P-II 1